MKWFTLTSLICAALAVPCFGKSPKSVEPRNEGQKNYSIGLSPGELTPTAEMWFYEQARRDYMDPKMMVRRKAEFESAERSRRLAAMRWHGFSPSRPSASTDPVHGDAGYHWSSGNAYFPMRWSSAGGTIVVPRSSSTARGD
jgi:hypothetical protein